MLLAIEGIDGAGKGTLCQALLIQAKKRGEMGTKNQVPARYAALLYGGDRFESRDVLLALIANNDLVILDRYIYSNVAYNVAKLPPAEQAELIAWIEELEFGMFELPRPDLTLLLATSTELANRLVGKKDKRGYTEQTRDIHEADRDYLSRVSEIYSKLAETGGDGWLTINPLDDLGVLRRPEDIAMMAWQHSALAAIG